jgi:hypothetical protein
MRQRKVPLLIHVDPMHFIALGYTCRYCPDCDLLVAHQDEIEHLLASLFAERDPSVIGNDYLVLGTVERAAWRAGLKESSGTPGMLEQLHDFREVWELDYRTGGWYREEDIKADEQARAQARAQFEAWTKETPRPAAPAKRRKKRRSK